jgi:AbrB family looped-hinge helix DNA binding protein
MLVENAKVLTKGQITLPKDIRAALGVSAGDRVTLIRRGNHVVIMNSAVYAMEMLQQAMQGEAPKAGLHSEEEVAAMLEGLRATP